MIYLAKILHNIIVNLEKNDIISIEFTTEVKIMIGTLLNNRYQVTKELGEGGFGQTFLAIDTHSPAKRQCVIKQLKPNNDPRTEQIIKERFAIEAAILETLGKNAPGNQIPRLDAYFEEKGEFYLVQEFVEGESLRDKLNNGVIFSENEVKNILINILPVLEYIHNQKIIHRDIKPDNIIIRKSDNKPVLIDFGAVKETLSTTVTMGGNVTSSIIIGTPGYMPPEQGAGRPVHSSDLFSLALTLIELLTGKMPQELTTNQQTGEIEWKIGINISRELGEILDKAISYHPRDRYSSASLMLNAVQAKSTEVAQPPINNYQQQKSTEVSQPPPPSQPPTQVVNRNDTTNNQSFPEWLNTVIMSSIIGVFILGGLYLFGKKNEPQPVVQNSSSPTPNNTPSISAEPSPIPTSNKVLYRIVDVASNDVLYVHSGPGVNTPNIASIPPYGRDIEIISDIVIVGVKRSPWARVRYQGIEGWVNIKFLDRQD